MLNYWLKTDVRRYTVKEPDPNDEWDHGAYSIELALLDVYSSEQKGWDINVIDTTGALERFDVVVPGEDAHVVCVQYRTGNTFGSDEDWCVWAIKIDYDEAMKLASNCRNAPGYQPWDGYFEQFMFADVTTLRMQ